MNTELKPSVQKAYLWFFVIIVLIAPGLLLLLGLADRAYDASGSRDDYYGLVVGLGLFLSMFLLFPLPVGFVVAISYIVKCRTWKAAFFVAQVLGILIVQSLGFFNILSSLPRIYFVVLLCIQYVVFFRTVFRMLPKAN